MYIIRVSSSVKWKKSSVMRSTLIDALVSAQMGSTGNVASKRKGGNTGQNLGREAEWIRKYGRKVRERMFG